VDCRVKPSPGGTPTFDVHKTPGADEPFYADRASSAAAAAAAPSFSPKASIGPTTAHVLPSRVIEYPSAAVP